jgi:hypothetical protein
VALGALAGALGRRWLVEVRVLTMVAGTLLAAVLVNARQGLPWQIPVIFGNLASRADYERAGTAVAARVGDAGVMAPQEIGTLAYYCDCEMLDSSPTAAGSFR